MTKEPDDYRRRWLASHQAPAYTCPPCGAESWSLEDAKRRYCGSCGAFKGKGRFIRDDYRPVNPELRRKVAAEDRDELKEGQ